MNFGVNIGYFSMRSPELFPSEPKKRHCMGYSQLRNPYTLCNIVNPKANTCSPLSNYHVIDRNKPPRTTENICTACKNGQHQHQSEKVLYISNAPQMTMQRDSDGFGKAENSTSQSSGSIEAGEERMFKSSVKIGTWKPIVK